MVHGNPDWGISSTKSTIFRVDDVGEAAVRLGSIVSYDRRGDVLWFDDFEDGLVKVVASTNGTGAAITAHTTEAHRGAACVSLIGGSDGGAFASIVKHVPFPVLSAFGVEAHIRKVDSPLSIHIFADVFDGTLAHRFQMRLLTSGGLLQLSTDDTTFVTIADPVVLGQQASAFHAIKLVFDPRTNLYVRLLINDTERDISATGTTPDSSGTSGALVGGVGVISNPVDNDELLVDDLIFTQNEPL